MTKDTVNKEQQLLCFSFFLVNEFLQFFRQNSTKPQRKEALSICLETRRGLKLKIGCLLMRNV
jgi:hypothetical protein